MKRALLAAIFALALGGAAAQPAAAAPTSSPLFPSQTFSNVATPARTFDIQHMVVDLDAGAAFRDAAGSSRFFTVMQGQVSATIGDQTDVLKASTDAAVAKSVRADPGLTVTMLNSGASNARLYISALVPAWDRGLQVEAVSGVAAPKVVFSGRFAIKEAPATVTVIQAGSQLDPDYAFSLHIMNNRHAMLHLTGTTSYEYVDGGRESYAAGQVGEMYVGRPGTMANRGTTSSAYVLTWLQVPGTALSLPFTAAAAAPAAGITAPSTGDGGLLPSGGAAVRRGFGVAALGVIFVVAMLRKSAWRSRQSRQEG